VFLRSRLPHLCSSYCKTYSQTIFIQKASVRDLLEKEDSLPRESRPALRAVVKILLRRFNQNGFHEATAIVSEIDTLLEKEDVQYPYSGQENTGLSTTYSAQKSIYYSYA